MRGSRQQELARDAAPQYVQNVERLVFRFQRIVDFLGGALGQRAIFEKLNDFADEFLIVVGELRTTADFFCPQPFQNSRGVAVTAMRQLGLLGLGAGGVKKILFVLFEQTVELAGDALARFFVVGGFQNFGGGEKINRRGVGTGRWREAKLVEFAPAEIGEQRGKLFDGGVGSQDSC